MSLPVTVPDSEMLPGGVRSRTATRMDCRVRGRRQPRPPSDLAGSPLMPGCQGGRRFASLGVGCGLAIWGPVRGTHRLRAPGQQGVRVGVNLVVGNFQAARWRGSTEPVLGLRFTGFLMCQASGREMSLPATVHDLEMVLGGVRSRTETRMDSLLINVRSNSRSDSILSGKLLQVHVPERSGRIASRNGKHSDARTDRVLGAARPQPSRISARLGRKLCAVKIIVPDSASFGPGSILARGG